MLRILSTAATLCLLAACGDSGSSMIITPEPQISGLSDQSGDANTPLGPVEFSVSDNDTAPNALLVTARTDNEALVREVVLGGTDTTRTVSVRPVADATGIANITVRVEDQNGQVSEDSFSVEFVLIATSFDSFVRDVFNDAANGTPRSINARSFDESQSSFDDLVN